jgi:hypothetical protein
LTFINSWHIFDKVFSEMFELTDLYSVLPKHKRFTKSDRMKNRMKYNFCLIILSLFFLSGHRITYAQQSVKRLAVITEINGEALIKEVGASGFTKASWGDHLSKGDQIATSDKSEVKLLFSESNSILVLGPKSMITISGNESPVTQPLGNVKTISSASMINLSALTSGREEKKDVGALAGVRSGDPDQAIEVTTPYNTLIKTDRPSFSWQTKKTFDKFTVNLYNSKGLVWSKKVAGLSMQYPESEKGLEFGESYFWNVEGEYLIDTYKSANRKFSLLPFEKLKEIGNNESIIKDTFKDNPESSSLHSVLGAYYIDQGLLQDAITEFQVIAQINADAALPHEMLGSLYSDVGEKDKAIEELQKALTLKNKEK